MQTKVVELDLNDVLPNRFQPRITFSEESIEALATSIKEHGVIQPIVVRSIGDKYEIIAGERRYKASVLAGKQTIPAIITDLNEKDSAEVALIENVQRKDLTPIEEAISYKKILDMGYLTQDSLALKLGKTQSTIANKLRLLNLDDDVQEALLNEKISERHARSLLKLSSHEKQRKLLNRIIEERLTVRKTDEEIDKMMNNDVNTEVFNLASPEELTMDINNNDVLTTEEIETLEIFEPNLEALNIPTEPILEDTIPEILPQFELNTAPSIFSPKPEIIQASVPPVPVSAFEELEETVETTIEENNKIEEIQNPIENNSVDVSIPEPNMADIFVEKPLAPIDSLLQSSNAPVGTINMEPVVPVAEEKEEDESAEDILIPGKFFNILPEVEEETVEVAPTTNEFSFDFDVNSLNNVENTNNLPSLDSIPTFENTTNVQEPQTDMLFNFMPTEPTDLNIPVVEESNQPIETEVPKVEAIEPVTIPELDTSNIEKPLVIPNETVQNNQVDIKIAIDMIRELSEKLTKMGYIVDLDEFDFENMYQVVFKVNK